MLGLITIKAGAARESLPECRTGTGHSCTPPPVHHIFIECPFSVRRREATVAVIGGVSSGQDSNPVSTSQ